MQRIARDRVDGCAELERRAGTHLEEAHGVDKVALVEREAVVDAGGHNQEVLGLDGDPDPALVALLCERASERESQRKRSRCCMSCSLRAGLPRRVRHSLLTNMRLLMKDDEETSAREEGRERAGKRTHLAGQSSRGRP